MRGMITIATLSVACSFDSQAPGGGSVGVGDDTDDTVTPAMSAGSTDEGDEGEAEGPSSQGSKTGSEGSGSADGTGGNETGPDNETTGSETIYGSCKEIKDAIPDAASGLFEIAPEGTSLPPPFWVYCDMDTDGGGWTLVARSVAASRDPDSFGWGAARGEPADTTEPYSLNVKAAALKFGQVLVGNHSGTLAWGGNAYRFDVANTFMAYEDDGVKVSNITTVVGDCAPDGGPAMLEFAGHTGASIFFLRDTDGYDNYGLKHDRFDLYEAYAVLSPCSHAGRLHDDEGMIMVR